MVCNCTWEGKRLEKNIKQCCTYITETKCCSSFSCSLFWVSTADHLVRIFDLAQVFPRIPTLYPGLGLAQRVNASYLRLNNIQYYFWWVSQDHQCSSLNIWISCLQISNQSDIHSKDPQPDKRLLYRKVLIQEGFFLEFKHFLKTWSWVLFWLVVFLGSVGVRSREIWLTHCEQHCSLLDLAPTHAACE